jgi:hypothetical protein
LGTPVVPFLLQTTIEPQKHASRTPQGPVLEPTVIMITQVQCNAQAHIIFTNSLAS